jgi:hypothetical protein
MRDLTDTENEMATTLFASTDRPPPHKGEGSTHLSVRFDPGTPGVIYWGYHARERRIRMRDVTVLSFKIDPTATTPTGGRWIKQTVVVRTKDGRKWAGTVKTGTDALILRRIKEEKKR